VLILLIFAVFLSVAYTTLNKLFAVFFILSHYIGENNRTLTLTLSLTSSLTLFLTPTYKD